MRTVDEIKAAAEQACPGLRLEIIRNESAAQQHSLLLSTLEHSGPFITWLQTNPALEMDYVSNVTGVDWPAIQVQEKYKVKETVDGVEKEIEKTRTVTKGGYLEVVYHLFSMKKRIGPVVVRMRTEDRTEKTALPSWTPWFRGAELQEREVYDLYGVQFTAHPDLRRILMWEGFKDHPMRKDYVDPDDYEYEPTPHDEVLERARRHYPGSDPGSRPGL